MKSSPGPGFGPIHVAPGQNRLQNGIQIFPGGVPIYRNGRLVGGIGVSGDGIDQDDMIAFLGTHNGSLKAGGGLANAVGDKLLAPLRLRLREFCSPQHLHALEVAGAQLGDDGAVMGAVALAMQQD